MDAEVLFQKTSCGRCLRVIIRRGGGKECHGKEVHVHNEKKIRENADKARNRMQGRPEKQRSHCNANDLGRQRVPTAKAEIRRTAPDLRKFPEFHPQRTAYQPGEQKRTKRSANS